VCYSADQCATCSSDYELSGYICQKKKNIGLIVGLSVGGGLLLLLILVIICIVNSKNSRRERSRLVAVEAKAIASKNLENLKQF
jgi:hypothetical protein